MRKSILGLVALAAAPMAVLAAPALDIDSVAGLYSAAPANAATDSGNASDVLEVVKLSPTTAYVRTHLEINDAVCAFWGVMHIDGDTLIGKDANLPTCELRLHFLGGKVRFEDREHYCHRESCGENGAFESVEFSAGARRPITYMKRLLASRQYQEALHPKAVK